MNTMKLLGPIVDWLAKPRLSMLTLILGLMLTARLSFNLAELADTDEVIADAPRWMLIAAVVVSTLAFGFALNVASSVLADLLAVARKHHRARKAVAEGVR